MIYINFVRVVLLLCGTYSRIMKTSERGFSVGCVLEQKQNKYPKILPGQVYHFTNYSTITVIAFTSPNDGRLIIFV